MRFKCFNLCFHCSQPSTVVLTTMKPKYHIVTLTHNNCTSQTSAFFYLGVKGSNKDDIHHVLEYLRSQSCQTCTKTSVWMWFLPNSDNEIGIYKQNGCFEISFLHVGPLMSKKQVIELESDLFTSPDAKVMHVFLRFKLFQT